MNQTTEQKTENKPANGAPQNPQAIQLRQAMETLKKGFEQWKPTLRAVLPKHIDPDRVIKIALNVFLNKPELHTCSPTSMIRATLQCAELGLDPTPLLQECAFVPFDNKKKVKDGNVWKEIKVLEVQLMPMYVGLIKLAKQTGDISDVYAVIVDDSEKVPEFDQNGRLVSGFLEEAGTVRRIQHIRKIEGRTGVLYAVYGVVKFKNGTNHYEVLSKSDVDKVRSMSKAKDASAWTDHYDEMAKKTAIRRTLKTVPKSPEKPQLAQALAVDTAAETGQSFSGDLISDVIDTDGVDVTEQTAATIATETSRTQKLSDALDGKPVKHDNDGVIQ